MGDFIPDITVNTVFDASIVVEALAIYATLCGMQDDVITMARGIRAVELANALMDAVESDGNDTPRTGDAISPTDFAAWLKSQN